MREILFRGKTYDGKWEQGDLRHGGYVHNDSETYIMRADVALHNIPVDPKTIGQYTGLTDKNGRKIFEGDIVRYTFDFNPTDEVGAKLRVSEVFWSDFRASWAVYAHGHIKRANSDLFRFVQNGNTVEVIGNIHDNPELMGGNKNE